MRIVAVEYPPADCAVRDSRYFADIIIPGQQPFGFVRRADRNRRQQLNLCSGNKNADDERGRFCREAFEADIEPVHSVATVGFREINIETVCIPTSDTHIVYEELHPDGFVWLAGIPCPSCNCTFANASDGTLQGTRSHLRAPEPAPADDTRSPSD